MMSSGISPPGCQGRGMAAEPRWLARGPRRPGCTWEKRTIGLPRPIFVGISGFYRARQHWLPSSHVRTGGLRTWEPTAGWRAYRVFRIIPRKSGCDAGAPGFSHVQPAHDAVGARRPGADSPHLDRPAQIGIRASPPHAIYCGYTAAQAVVPPPPGLPAPGPRRPPQPRGGRSV